MFKNLRLLIPLCPIIAMFMHSPARAEANPVITEPTDFWFQYDEPTQFLAQTFMIDGYESDPQLWLYNESGELITTNDDYIGLQSKIDLLLPAGSYRLRASTCCNEPDVWRDGVVWNVRYELSFNGIQSNPSTTTTTESPTTTTEPVTTTSSTTSTTTTTTTTVPETTTTWVITTTTSTTTLPVETTTTSLAPIVTSSIAPVVNTETPTTLVETTIAPVTETTVEVSPSTPLSSSTSTSVVSTTSTTSTEPQESPATTVNTTVPEEPAIPDSGDLGELNANEIASILDSSVLETLSTEEITTLIDDIVDSELTDEQAEAIAEAMTDAPNDVKEEFEAKADVFGGQFDSYVPIDSRVSVGQRRVVIAATATAIVIPAAASNTRKK